MARKAKIMSVRIERVDDECPDLSWLGEYSNTPGPCAIDRQARGDRDRHESRYWNPGNHAPHNPAEWAHVSNRQVIAALNAIPIDQRNRLPKAINYPARYVRSAAIAYLDSCYVEQDYRRHERFGRDWYTIGIIAKAEVQLAGSSLTQTLRSPGLWGIESDSGEDYLRSVEREELDAISLELRAIGCTDKQITAAIKSAGL